MITNAYTIFDNKAFQYYPPFFAPTDGAAIRSLKELVNDPQTTVSKHPNDYVLYLCGTYDDSNGAFVAESPLRYITDAVALVEVNTRNSNPFSDKEVA